MGMDARPSLSWVNIPKNTNNLSMKMANYIHVVLCRNTKNVTIKILVKCSVSIYINKKATIYKAYYISNQKQKKVDIFKFFKDEVNNVFDTNIFRQVKTGNFISKAHVYPNS